MNAGAPGRGGCSASCFSKSSSNNGTHPAAQRYPGADAPHRRHIPSIRRFMSGDAAPSGSTATRNCWLATYKSFSGCAGPDLRRLEAEIAALLDANRHPVAGSSFVRMAFTPAGDLLLIPGAVSFYDGYALRSLRPAAAVVNYGVPYPEYPHLGTRSSCMLALQAAVTADNRAAEADIERAAVRTGVQAVIRCDGEGFVHVCDEAPLFAVKGKKVYTPPAPPECRTGIGMPGRRSRPPASAGAGDRPGATCPFRRNFSMSITGASPRYRPAKGNSTPQSSPNVSPAS